MSKMVDRQTRNTIIDIVRKYAATVGQQYCLKELYLFGSYAKGNPHEDSDIDIAVVSDDFTGDTYDDQLALMKLRYDVDLRIEPHPFLTEDFTDENPFAYEIMHTGIQIV